MKILLPLDFEMLKTIIHALEYTYETEILPGLTDPIPRTLRHISINACPIPDRSEEHTSNRDHATQKTRPDEHSARNDNARNDQRFPNVRRLRPSMDSARDRGFYDQPPSNNTEINSRIKPHAFTAF